MLELSIYALGLTVAYLTYITYQALFSPLRKIPGPFFARFSRLWLLYRTWLGRVDKDLLTLHEKYGTIVRYGPSHYSVSDPEAIQRIYGQGHELDKAGWYAAWGLPEVKTLFTEPNVKKHSQMKRKFNATYTMSSMVTYETFADRCIELICRRLEEIAGASGETDLYRWLLAYAADAVSMITYSKRMGFLDTGDDVGDFFKTLDGNSLYATLVGIYYELHPLLFKTTAAIGKLGLGFGNSRVFINIFNARLIEEKKAERAGKVRSSNIEISEDGPKDFLAKFLDFHEDNPDRFTNRDIHVGLSGNIIAGSDTTGSTLTAIFYCLMKNRGAMSKLRKEIATATEEGRLSSPPVFKEAYSLPYLQAVIQEALRMHAPTGLPLQREIPAAGAEICSYFFPAGTSVGAHILAVHRNKAIWGDDAYQFRPERWLESDNERLGNMQRHWIPFGLGTRTCIGKNISMLEISKLVPELVRRFDFELTHGIEREHEELKWINRWFIKPSRMPVRVKLREGIK